MDFNFLGVTKGGGNLVTLQLPRNYLAFKCRKTLCCNGLREAWAEALPRLPFSDGFTEKHAA